jgi:FkbH-like protein
MMVRLRARPQTDANPLRKVNDRMSVATLTPPAATQAQRAPVGLQPYWLPYASDLPARIKALNTTTDPAAAWNELVALADTRLDFIRTGVVDRALQRHFGKAPPAALTTRPVKLAVLGSSTLGHLLPAIRIAALRRGLWVQTYEGEYNQSQQELADPKSALHAFKPDAVLFAFDAAHLLRGATAAADPAQADALLDATLAQLRECWRGAREAFRCHVIQQTVVPVFPALLGNNEHRLPGSPRHLVTRLNAALRTEADANGVDLLALDDRVAQDGLAAWHDPVLWHRAKQEISPAASPIYGELLARLLGARQGRSRKCLVLDLDNTLWGGVIGDDGLEGIVLGQGSALGEAFLAVQHYAREQSRRGVILAVCSKNDEANALAPFEQHPEMVLKRQDIACFVANWQDKASNIRSIAQQLNIGLDSLVFLDDNPFERNLVRGELPMVAVPEVSEDPALMPACLADAGYFEGLGVTDEDRTRAGQYQANIAREALATEAADLPTYLRGLNMELVVRPFDRIGLARIVQLINKTNQFNLTTRRYTEDEVLAVMSDPRAFGLQLRLLDRFGDNGIIAIVIGRMIGDDEALVDTWLMSCRVLGRGVEEATLAQVAAASKGLGANRLIGEYRPTAKNAMVREHYQKLGFSPLRYEDDGKRIDVLDLETYVPAEIFIAIKEG